MNDVEQRVAAKAFAAYWKDKGYEKGESQSFWLSLLRDVFGKEHPEQFILFEEQVHLDHTSFIDGNIPETKVLIEQKGLGKDLRKPIKQSDGTYLIILPGGCNIALNLLCSPRIHQPALYNIVQRDKINQVYFCVRADFIHYMTYFKK